MTISSEGKARLAKIRSQIAFRRHAELRASGKPARFGELTPERIEAQRKGRLGKFHKPEAKAAIGAGVSAFHEARRERQYQASIFANGFTVATVFVEPKQRGSHGKDDA